VTREEGMRGKKKEKKTIAGRKRDAVSRDSSVKGKPEGGHERSEKNYFCQESSKTKTTTRWKESSSWEEVRGERRKKVWNGGSTACRGADRRQKKKKFRVRW